MALDGEVEQVTGRRIRRARETRAALELLFRDRSAENVAALHELHASHCRELGDEDGAVRAQGRAKRTRQRALAGVSVPHAPSVRSHREEHAMYDPTDERPRYLVHYSDGGSGMRRFDGLAEIGQELRNGGSHYRIVHAEHPVNPGSFGHAWAEPIGAT
jgi:hypothetical protein